MNNGNNECCPKFYPQKWDEKSHDWKRKLFIKTSIPTLFHIPFPPMIGKKIKKMMAGVEASGIEQETMDKVLLLFMDPTPFRSEIYLSVTGEIPNAKNVEISGSFMSKVFDGPYNAIPGYIKQMEVYLDEKGIKSKKKYFVHYAYCPKCAKEAGHNYMILFSEVQANNH
jgi:hypothetical protein